MPGQADAAGPEQEAETPEDDSGREPDRVTDEAVGIHLIDEEDGGRQGLRIPEGVTHRFQQVALMGGAGRQP